MSTPFTARLRRIALRFFVPRPLVTVYYLARYGTRVSPRAEVELSPNLRFGRDCTVSSFVKIKASDGPLEVGDHTGFGTGCFVSSGAAGIQIGHHVLVGPNVSIVGSSYVHDEIDVPFEDQGNASKGIRIGNNVWLGAGCVVADGARIGDNTIVVANSLVTRRYPANVIIQGAPAKVIFHRDRKSGGENECATPSTKSSEMPSRTSTRSSATKS